MIPKISGSFQFFNGPGYGSNYLLNPALGEEVITARLAQLRRANRVVSRAEAGGFASAVIGFILLIAAAVNGWPPLLAALLAAAVTAFAICCIVGGRNSFLANKMRNEWVESGDAICIYFLTRYLVKTTLSAEAAWKAAELDATVSTMKDRARWAKWARQGAALPAGALEALEMQDQAIAAKVDEIAEILDPGGEATSAWLLDQDGTLLV